MIAETEPTRAEGGAARVVGATQALAMVAGSMLGVGIFLQPRLVANLVASPAAFLLAWAIGGVIALCGAVAYADLGRLFPRAGGDYVFVREAFGSGAAFAAGWVLMAGVFAGSIATMTVATCTYQLPTLFPGFVADAASIVPGLQSAQLTALALIAGFTAINVFGTSLGVRVQVLLTLVPFGLLTVFAVYAVLFTTPSVGADVVPVSATTELGAILRAQLPIYFAYAGWNAIAYIGGELRDPRRTVAVGLLGGTLAVTALYLLLGAAFLSVLSLDGLRNTFEAGSATAGALGGARAEQVAALLIALALLGTANGTVLAGARVVWAMSCDGVLPRTLANIHPRFGTPTRALLAQGAVACVLVLSGTYDLLMELTSIAMLLLGAITVAGLFVIRRRRSESDVSVIAHLSRPLGAVYILLAAAVVVGELADIVETVRGGPLSVAALLPAAGLVLFLLVWSTHSLLRIQSSVSEKSRNPEQSES